MGTRLTPKCTEGTEISVYFTPEIYCLALFLLVKVTPSARSFWRTLSLSSSSSADSKTPNIVRAASVYPKSLSVHFDISSITLALTLTPNYRSSPWFTSAASSSSHLGACKFDLDSLRNVHSDTRCRRFGSMPFCRSKDTVSTLPRQAASSRALTHSRSPSPVLGPFFSTKFGAATSLAAASFYTIGCVGLRSLDCWTHTLVLWNSWLRM